jgi:large subunit ribosomal protein L20
MEAVARAQKHATIHRRQKKRDFRRLWIVRINAACRQLGMTYSQFIRGLKEAKIDLNRKVLADLAVHDSDGFAELVTRARAALPTTS